MKIVTWIKSLSWIAILGAIGTAAMMIMNARRAGKMEAEVAHQENEITKLNKGSEVEIRASAELQAKITAKKIKARAVRKKSEASLERLGQEETMADIAKRFNGKRVRKRSSSVT
jgi:uncharacterized coiled-coil protein SlyX